MLYPPHKPHQDSQTASLSKKMHPSTTNLPGQSLRSNPHALARSDAALGLPLNAHHRPESSSDHRRSASAVITAKQLGDLQHRHQMQLALVKQEARELKEEKAFLVAQNLRLERELCLQNQALGAGGHVESRKLDSKARPPFHRSRSQPSADLRDPHHPLCSSSPTHSCSSCSSHPWASSGGTNTHSSNSPNSNSPRSHHSRNPSSASLAVPSSHAPPMSRRPSFSSGGPPATSAPDPALLYHRLRLASRQQKLAPSCNALNRLRPLSVASNACDEPRPVSSRSNPASRGVSRRNSVSGGSNHDPPPLKGILKPSTPIRPVSSCSNAVVPPARPSTGIGYYVDEGYDSITHPNGHRTLSSAFNQSLHHSTIPTSRSRRASLDKHGAGECMNFKNSYF